MLASLVMSLALVVAQLPVAAPADPRDELVTIINRARVRAGVLPLARAPELDAAAQAHSADMVLHNYLDHTGSDGSEPQQRAEQAGYTVPPRSGWIVVEVISAISGEPQGAVSWWLGEARQHRPVLLNPRWREIGVGYAQGGEYGHYWTADFGCRPGVLPTPTLDETTYTTTEQCVDPQSEAALAA
ncbi:MAG: CAP domain-containing protein [Chloroflexi bacterium]|nr:CAP domain-containing protein [Chloroflexota bacterium]